MSKDPNSAGKVILIWAAIIGVIWWMVARQPDTTKMSTDQYFRYEQQRNRNDWQYR